MREKIHKKLRSRTGASISFALLLFLVCMVVGAVVLAAGTTAAGRISKAVEMDQRYYSVTSAAELLAQELNNEKVIITRSKEVKKTVTTEYKVTSAEDENGVVTITVTPSTPSTSYEATYSTKFNPASVQPVDVVVIGDTEPVSTEGSAISFETGNYSFLTERAIRLMFGEKQCNTDEAMGYSFAGGNEETATYFTLDFTLEHSTTDPISVDALKIQGTYELKSDGTLILRISDSANTDNYTLLLTMKPVISETESQTTSGGDVPEITATSTGYTEVYTTTTRTEKTSEITWVLDSVAKEVAQANGSAATDP